MTPFSSLPPRRHYERFSCLLPVRARIAGSGRHCEGHLLNISMGGGLLRLQGTVPVPTDLHLDVEIESKRLHLHGHVVRDAGSDPDKAGASLYGLSFDLDSATQEILRNLVNWIRTQKPPGGR